MRAGTERREWTYPGPDGRLLHAVLWMPPAPPKGMIQILHGLMEHTLRYDETARFLCARGYAVCGVDLPGHGQSDSDAPGFLARRHGWELALETVRGLRTQVGGSWPRWVLLGHSMGSFLVRTWLIRRPGEADGAVLSGTAQKRRGLVPLGRALTEAGCVLCAPRHRIPGAAALYLHGCSRRIPHPATDLDWVSRDPAAVREAQTALDHFPIAGLLRDMLAGMQYNTGHAGDTDPDVPIYIFSGDQDPVGDYGAGARRTAALFARCRDVTVRLYPGGRHEMLHETNRDQVLRDLAEWLDGHITAAEQPKQGRLST